jgi:ATP-dependent DNA helicase RecQ
MLEEELYNDYKAVYLHYIASGKQKLIDEFTGLLLLHSAIDNEEYINKIQLAIQLEEHVNKINNIKNKYLHNDRSEN